jgi:hypothetical protein
MDRKNRRTNGEPDTAQLVEIVSLARDIVDATNARVAREKFTEVVQLAYEHAQLTGTIDRQYLTRLINLAR